MTGPAPGAGAIRAAAKRAGLDATDRPEASAGTDVENRWDPQRTVEALGAALSALHSTVLADAGDAPPLGAEHVVAQARRRIEAGDVPVVDEAYAHMPVERLLDILANGVADLAVEAPVATHGNPGPATLRLVGGVGVGFVGWAGAAVSDRHRDLAVAATEVAGTLGPMLVPVLFDAYGSRPDPRRLDWWALAHQLLSAGPAHG